MKNACRFTLMILISIVFNATIARAQAVDVAAAKKEGRVVVYGSVVPQAMEGLGAKICYRLEEALPQADVVIALRLQLERQQERYIPSFREYARFYGLDREKLAKAKPELIVMHPGPVNRGVELAPEVADGPQSVILDQVTNGIAVRMAVLYLVCGMQTTEEPASMPEPSPEVAG